MELEVSRRLYRSANEDLERCISLSFCVILYCMYANLFNLFYLTELSLVKATYIYELKKGHASLRLVL
jgi:hypothetical protein